MKWRPRVVNTPATMKRYLLEAFDRSKLVGTVQRQCFGPASVESITIVVTATDDIIKYSKPHCILRSISLQRIYRKHESVSQNRSINVSRPNMDSSIDVIIFLSGVGASIIDPSHLAIGF